MRGAGTQQPVTVAAQGLLGHLVSGHQTPVTRLDCSPAPAECLHLSAEFFQSSHRWEYSTRALNSSGHTIGRARNHVYLTESQGSGKTHLCTI